MHTEGPTGRLEGQACGKVCCRDHLLKTVDGHKMVDFAKSLVFSLA